jgi:hypothetical protein
MDITELWKSHVTVSTHAQNELLQSTVLYQRLPIQRLVSEQLADLPYADRTSRSHTSNFQQPVMRLVFACHGNYRRPKHCMAQRLLSNEPTFPILHVRAYFCRLGHSALRFENAHSLARNLSWTGSVYVWTLWARIGQQTRPATLLVFLTCPSASPSVKLARRALQALAMAYISRRTVWHARLSFRLAV